MTPPQAITYALERARADRDSEAALAELAQCALAQGEQALALEYLMSVVGRQPGRSRLWQWIGLLERDRDCRIEAAQAFGKAVALEPSNRSIVLGQAQVYLEAGFPASALYREALSRWRGDHDLILGYAAALFAEGNSDDAIAMLEEHLLTEPNWIDGHRQLAQLLALVGRFHDIGASYKRGLASPYGSPYLWWGLVDQYILAEQYERALETIGDARTKTGDTRHYVLNEAVARAELGDRENADLCFARLGAPDDIHFATRLVRHHLRSGRIEMARDLAERWKEPQAGPFMWPYLASIWRFMEDPRSQWLEGDERTILEIDLSDQIPSLKTLQSVLFRMHHGAGSFLDQSVRGGTQTAGHLLLREEPEIRELREIIRTAVCQYITRLPPIDPRHPLLSQRRDLNPRFAGSWSVLLRQGGKHNNHVHPEGWISSALYLSLPENMGEGGKDRSGWLTLGAPASELGMGLEPTRVVRPVVGKLVLFPSTMWHGTVPFSSGERMTIAFDIAYPGRFSA